MKAQELRIGNLIYAPSGIIVEIKEGLDIDFIKNYKPIPLTEDWLIKMGFKKHNHSEREKGYRILKTDYAKTIYIRTDCEPKLTGFFSLFNYSSCVHNEIQFIKRCYNVHELQNAYYFITGEELTIEP